MADSNIAGLPAGAAIADTDLIAGSDAGSGTLVKKTGLQFNTYINTKLANLPTSDPHVIGALWNNGGLVAISTPFLRSLSGASGAYALTGSTATLIETGAPSFQIDFMAVSVLPAELSFSRASAGTYFDSSGVLQSAAIDTPRFDHDPGTLAALGILIEEQRTNLFLTSAVPANQTITVSNSTDYTVSFYGTGTLTLTGAVSHTVTGSSATVKTSYTFNSATTSLVIAVSGSVVYPNVEAGSFATSHIPTTGASATRSADILYLASTALTAFIGAASSAIIEVDGVPTTYGVILSSTTAPTLILRNGASATDLFTQANGVFVAASVADTQATFRAGLSRDSGGISLVGNGGTVATDATAATSLSGADVQVAGRISDGDYMNKHVRSMAIYNSRISNATLQSKSNVGATY